MEFKEPSDFIDTTEIDKAMQEATQITKLASATKKEATPITSNEWACSGISFRVRPLANKYAKLPGGIYQFVMYPDGDWSLDLISRKFEFPFKIYENNDHIIERICTYWRVNGGNLGVLLNGTRGTGKTLTAQHLANKLVNELNLPVLVVRYPIPLQAIFENVQQDLMVIFDEFEKTHKKPEEQQALLSTIDGMSRSEHNRLVIFTTNSPTVDENFKDRPSRIHYQFEFDRISDEVIEAILNDSLPKNLHHFKASIYEYLNSRAICTIDIVKAVISEVKTFKEPPADFEEMLNITKAEPPSFIIKLIDPETNKPLETVYEYFRCRDGYEMWTGLLTQNKHRVKEFVDRRRTLEIVYNSIEGTYRLNLLDKCKEDNMWLANLAVPKNKTPYKSFWDLACEGYYFWLDEKPKDWKFTYTPESVKENPGERKKLRELWDNSLTHQTVYGSDKKAIVKISIEPNKEPYTRTWSTSKSRHWDFE